MINDWIPFFTELSGKLLAYRNNRQELISLIKTIFDETGIDMPRLDSDGLPIDIDPFTVQISFLFFCTIIQRSSLRSLSYYTIAKEKMLDFCTNELYV